jgi:hypothetical protein
MRNASSVFISGKFQGYDSALPFLSAEFTSDIMGVHVYKEHLGFSIYVLKPLKYNLQIVLSLTPIAVLRGMPSSPFLCHSSLKTPPLGGSS